MINFLVGKHNLPILMSGIIILILLNSGCIKEPAAPTVTTSVANVSFDPTLTGVVLVNFFPNVTEDEIRDVVHSYGYKIKNKYEFSFGVGYSLEIPGNETLSEAAATLNSDSRVRGAEPEVIYHPLEGTS